MDKNTEIKFVGQPVFKQILNLITKVNAFYLFERELGNSLVEYEFRSHLMPGSFYNSLVGLHNSAPIT